MRRASPDLLLALAALGAVALLTGLAHWSAPEVVTLLDAAEREGARVAVEARVLDVHDGARARRLMLSDGAHRLPAFAPLSPAIERGDRIWGAGIVSRESDGILLSLDEMRVIEPTARIVRSPADLAQRPAEFVGARVVVEGDARGGALVGGGARVTLAGDAKVSGAAIVTGAFRYRETDASYVLWVESWTPRS